MEEGPTKITRELILFCWLAHSWSNEVQVEYRNNTLAFSQKIMLMQMTYSRCVLGCWKYNLSFKTLQRKKQKWVPYPAGLESFAFAHGQHDQNERVCQIHTELFPVARGFVLHARWVFPSKSVGCMIVAQSSLDEHEKNSTATECHWGPNSNSIFGCLDSSCFIRLNSETCGAYFQSCRCWLLALEHHSSNSSLLISLIDLWAIIEFILGLYFLLQCCFQELLRCSSLGCSKFEDNID